MSFRITTNGMFRAYRANLTRSTKNLNDAMTRVQTERYFNSYAEDPASANRAFQLRRSYWNNGNQMNNSNYLISKFQTGWDSLKSAIGGDTEHPGLDGILESLRGITGTAGAGRATLGQTLMSTADAFMGAMNVRYGDEYVFAGADGLNPPFSWQTTTDANGNVVKKLLYRGIPVDADGDTVAAFEKLKASSGLPDTSSMTEPLTEEKFIERREEELAKKEANEPYEAMYTQDFDWYKEAYAWQNQVSRADVDAYYANSTGYAQIQDMNAETTLVDIGLGFRLQDDGTINPATAYDSSISGAEILGFGVDEDGDPLNLVSLMQELGEIFNRCVPESGEYASDEDAARAEVLVEKLRSAVDRVQEQHVKLDGRSTYLIKNLGQLEDNKLNLNVDIENIERMDMAAAIGDMLWAQYSYNAALRIGGEVLSQSLFDYFG